MHLEQALLLTLLFSPSHQCTTIYYNKIARVAETRQARLARSDRRTKTVGSIAQAHKSFQVMQPSNESHSIQILLLVP